MSGAQRILFALAAGLVAGIVSASLDWRGTSTAAGVAQIVGGVWLDMLRMTIIPLIVSILVVGIANTAEAARTSRLAGMSLALFVTLLMISAIISAIVTPFLLKAFPLGRDAINALNAAVPAISAPSHIPGLETFLRSIVPTNPIAAAANDSILPLIFFTTIFAFALTRIPQRQRRRLTLFFESFSSVMLVMIEWILWLAPLGVFGLAFVLGASAGAAAFGALVHYVLIVSSVGFVIILSAYLVAVFGARLALARFAQAIMPAQAVAVSTQSSLASMPAMLRGAERLGIPIATAGTVLPVAVAVFRVTGPAMNLAVVLYVASWTGTPIAFPALVAAVLAAVITSMGSVSLPGQIGFVTATAPIAMAAGVPIEPLLLLVAIENIPDVVRTVGNVTMDVAATATLSRYSHSSSNYSESRTQLS